MPLLKGKFGKNYKNISAIWLATRIKRHLSTRDLIKKKSKFGYLTNTYNQTINKNTSYIEKNGSKIIYNSKIKKIKVSNNRITNIITNKNNIVSKNEKVISTIPLFCLKEILNDKKLNYLKKFNGIGVIVCIARIRKKVIKILLDICN